MRGVHHDHQDRDHHYADRPHRTQARRLPGRGRCLRSGVALGGRDKASTVSAASLTARECYNRLRRRQAPRRHSLYLSREPSPRHPSACACSSVASFGRGDGGRAHISVRCPGGRPAQAILYRIGHVYRRPGGITPTDRPRPGATPPPRAGGCGGPAYECALQELSDGLSPRVRGNRVAHLRNLTLVGSIPACAGEP